MQCTQCQHENTPDAKFCNQCGMPFAPKCAACGRENAADAKFCNQCATPITTSTSAPHAIKPDAESRFHATLPVLTGLLKREGRITYRELKHIFGLNDALLDEIREALALKRLAVDEDDKVLVWTGETQPAVQPAVAMPTPSPPEPGPPT